MTKWWKDTWFLASVGFVLTVICISLIIIAFVSPKTVRPVCPLFAIEAVAAILFGCFAGKLFSVKNAAKGLMGFIFTIMFASSILNSGLELWLGRWAGKVSGLFLEVGIIFIAYIIASRSYRENSGEDVGVSDT